MKYLVFTLMMLVYFSCDRPETPVQVQNTANMSQNQIDSILLKYNFEYENPVMIDSSETILIPISTEYSGKRKSISKGYSSESYPRYWNMLFFDQKTNATKLLTESKVRIVRFDVNLKKTGNILSKSILYELGDIDYNGDDKLDYRDPCYLFISDDKGENLRRLSPQNEYLAYYSIIPNTDRLILRTRRDINMDREFDKNDEHIWYLLDLEANKGPVEIVDEQLRKRVGNLYFDQWLKSPEEN